MNKMYYPLSLLIIASTFPIFYEESYPRLCVPGVPSRPYSLRPPPCLAWHARHVHHKNTSRVLSVILYDIYEYKITKGENIILNIISYAPYLNLAIHEGFEVFLSCGPNSCGPNSSNRGAQDRARFSIIRSSIPSLATVLFPEGHTDQFFLGMSV